MELNEVTYATLNNKFIVVESPTDSGNVYVPNGQYNQLFAVVDGDIYHIKFAADQVADPTKGELVVSLNADNNLIYWKQAHKEQQVFEEVNSLHSAKYLGDAGQPLIEALQAHIIGTFNVAGYDTRLVTIQSLVQGITTADGVDLGNIDVPSDVAAVPTTTGAKVTTSVTIDRSKQSLVLYKKDGTKVTQGTVGTNEVDITGLAAGTVVAAGDYQVAYAEGTTESSKVDVPGFTVLDS